MSYDPQDRAEIQELRARIMQMEADMELARLQLHADRERMRHEFYVVESVRSENKRLKERARQDAVYVECYRKLQEAVLGNPGLMEQWKDFCFMLKLSDPELYKYTTQG